MNIPEELRYTKSHEWLKEEDGVCTVGLTDFAQHALGDIVFVNLPQEGDPVTAGEALGDVESVKAVSDVLSPVSGVVKAVNEELLDNPALVNEDPYGAWLIQVEQMTDEEELLDAANASVYDGASAAAEAVAMCRERKRTRAVVSAAAHPDVISTIRTYSFGAGTEVAAAPAENGVTDLTGLLDETTACVYVQQPNFFGQLEDLPALAAQVHAAGARLIVGVNPAALGVLESPGACGADIAVGEGQPLGLPLSWGGPYLGFMAASQSLMRRLPGRIVGETRDSRGERAFVLTLQAREQHIRREKASSNVCSNEALCALTASVYLSLMGPDGLRQVGEQCHAKAHYLAAELCRLPGVSLRYPGPFFHEFVTDLPEPQKVLSALESRGILGGWPVEGGLLWCATEKQSRAELDEAVSIVKEVLD